MMAEKSKLRILDITILEKKTAENIRRFLVK